MRKHRDCVLYGKGCSRLTRYAFRTLYTILVALGVSGAWLLQKKLRKKKTIENSKKSPQLGSLKSKEITKVKPVIAKIPEIEPSSQAQEKLISISSHWVSAKPPQETEQPVQKEPSFLKDKPTDNTEELVTKLFYQLISGEGSEYKSNLKAILKENLNKKENKKNIDIVQEVVKHIKPNVNEAREKIKKTLEYNLKIDQGKVPGRILTEHKKDILVEAGVKNLLIFCKSSETSFLLIIMIANFEMNMARISLDQLGLFYTIKTIVMNTNGSKLSNTHKNLKIA